MFTELSIRDWQTVGASIARKAKSVRAKSVAVALSNEMLDIFGTKESAQGLTEGMVLGAYTFLKHKSADTREKDHVIADAAFLVAAGRLDSVAHGIHLGELVSSAVIFARDLVNEPPSTTTPTHLGTSQIHSKNTPNRLLGIDKEEMRTLVWVDYWHCPRR
jgi:leucyl aminopeptidase